MLKYATILILAITFICDAAFAQNSNCFRPTMPPMDVIAACDAIIDTEPRAAQAHQARGIAWYRMGNCDEAIDDFNQSIAFDPNYIRAFFNRALAWEQKGKLDDALADLKYFIELDSSFPDAQI